MDTLRGTFESDRHGTSPDLDGIEDLAADGGPDANEGEAARDLPPAAIGQDERRMQVRAYNHWASLLGERTFPSIEDLEPAHLPDFGPHSVLLDFSAGIDDPIVQYLGATLARECGTDAHIQRLSDVPPRSLLSRITDHYLQIMANQAPIGFEAEFVNQRGASILYRGILLPFSSDDESIDFIYGVINWKEMADAATADELLLEIDQAIEAEEAALDIAALPRNPDPIADWADSPAHEAGASDGLMDDNILDLGVDAQELGGPLDEPSHEPHDTDLPMPDFGHYTLDDPDEDEDDEDAADYDDGASYSFASLADYIEAPSKKAVDLDAEKFDPADYEVDATPGEENGSRAERATIPVAYEPESEHSETDQPATYQAEAYQPEISFPTEVSAAKPAQAFEQESAQDTVHTAAHDDSGTDAATEEAAEESITVNTQPSHDADIHDCLAAARELAYTARASEDRSRQALYAAVGRAYDFSLAAQDAPHEYDALIEESGLTMQDRAPMTPVVKLVFGGDYDKTRLTEYAAALAHAHRLQLERGKLADFLLQADGGLKGVVKAERRLRREESGKPVKPEDAIREALARKLRELEAMTIDALAADGPEFALVMVRRDGSGGIDVVGEITGDTGMVERAARKLVG